MKLILISFFLWFFILTPGMSQQNRGNYHTLHTDKEDTTFTVFHTDSVYSFLHSFSSVIFGEEPTLFRLKDEPVSSVLLLQDDRFNKILSDLRRNKDQELKEKGLLPEIINHLISIICSPETIYNPPIIKWNVSRLGPEWITESNHSYLYTLIEKRMRMKDEENYSDYRDFFFNANRYQEISLSTPVFDPDYTMAFITYNIGNGPIVAICKRMNNEWKTIFTTHKIMGE